MATPTIPRGRRLGALSEGDLAPDGRFLVIAGPGAGKTRQIVSRVELARAAEQRQGNVLVLTFTNKAAIEVTSRLQVSDDAETASDFVGTFHAFGSRVLHSHGDAIGMPTDFVIYMPEDQTALIEELQSTGELPSSVSATALRSRFAHEKELASERLVSGEPDSAISASQSESLRSYQKAMRGLRGLDLPDLIYECNRLFALAPFVRDLYRTMYSHVLVDEFQDTTPGQYALLRQLVHATAGNVFAVADEDQLIFEWNEARLDTLNRFCDDFHPSIVYSTLCHRCPTQVVVAANAVIRRNRFRFPDKPDISPGRDTSGVDVIRVVAVDSEEKELEIVTSEILKLIRAGHSLSEIAVISRAGWLLNPFEEELTSKGLPAARPSLGGLGETEEAEVVVRLIRWIQNEWDAPSVRKVLGFFYPETMGSIDRAISGARGKGIPAEAVILTEVSSNESPLHSFIADVAALRLMAGDSTRMLSELSRRVLPPMITALGDPEAGAEMDRVVRGLCDLCQRMSPRHRLSLSDFLIGLPSLVAPSSSTQDEGTEQAVSLLTCHQAKGTEFPYVFATCMEESIFPDYRQARSVEGIEAERRLFYVTMTRTITQITFSWSKSRRNVSGVTFTHRPSRFLGELPPELTSNLVP